MDVINPQFILYYVLKQQVLIFIIVISIQHLITVIYFHYQHHPYFLLYYLTIHIILIAIQLINFNTLTDILLHLFIHFTTTIS